MPDVQCASVMNGSFTENSPSGPQFKCCLSFTAPTISEDECQREHDELSEEERQALSDDMSGIAPIIHETEEFIKISLKQFDEALDLVPVDQKRAYAEALNTAPDLVQKETHPLKFLRSECFHAENAANGLPKYWEHRLELFGRERAFLPMDVLTGEGAMSLQDIDFLRRSKSVYLLTQEDPYGRLVCYVDRSKWKTSVRKSLLRSIFFTVHMASKSANAQKHGLVMIIDMQNVSTGDHCRKLTRNVIRILKDNLPIRLRVIHTCAAAKISPAALVRGSILFMYGKSLRLRNLRHYGCPSELIWDLEQHGLSKQIIPEELGGLNPAVVVESGRFFA
mmetsp:Transcript_3903/g.5122  ORF Transcript_3903/g.5122 Transcript_3903/m.5122 type:complete len:336 (-) Transcript_3903:269-1276(-)